MFLNRFKVLGIFFICTLSTNDSFAIDRLSDLWGKKYNAIIEKHMLIWTEARRSVPSYTNDHKGYQDLFNELKSAGYFPKELTFDRRMFGHSSPYKKENAGLSIQLQSDGVATKFLTYRLKNSKMNIVQLEYEDSIRHRNKMYGDKPVRLIPIASNNYQEQLSVIELELRACRLNDPRLLNVLSTHVARWRNPVGGILPSKTDFEGYQHLLADLKKIGFYNSTKKFDHTLFDIDPGFTNNRLGYPNLFLNLDIQYEAFSFDMDKYPPVLIGLSRPCASSTLKRLREEQRVLSIEISTLSQDKNRSRLNIETKME